MPPISVMIKPSSGLCNMKCKYCFYCDVMSIRAVPQRGFMTLDTAENLIKRIFEAAERNVSIAFQGGEPTLIGLDFFKAFAELVKKYNTAKLPVSFGLQTNGTTIDDDWCMFYRENKFLIGVSLDGDGNTHDYLRATNGTGNYRAVLKGIRLLENYGVDFNILTVVTKYVARHYKKIYEDYKAKGFKYLQFIPCLDPFDGRRFEHSLTAQQYGEFLVGLYDLWVRDYRSGNYVSIRLFDNLINRLNGRETELCGLNGVCSIQNIVESDGTVYPCDFYCTDEFALGNINESSFKELFESGNAQKFLKESLEISEECRACRFFALCRCGCRRERIEGSNTFCASYKKLFERMTE